MLGGEDDPLLAKLIVWAETRPAAIARMERALAELVIVGVQTSQPFHARVMRDAAFASGVYDIGFLEARGAELLAQRPDDEELALAAVAAALAEHAARQVPRAAAPGGPPGPRPASGSPRLQVARSDGGS